ncbi:MAG: DNA alkylation repair protein [Acidimicrobiales bacterium]
MVEPFKNFFGVEPIRSLAEHLARIDPGFPMNEFVAYAIEGLDDLELKERSTQITDGLVEFLSSDFREAAQVLLDSLHPETGFGIAEMEATTNGLGVAGWLVMPLADYVTRVGLDDVEFSLEVLRQMTMRSSSEFAVREFFVSHPEPALAAFHRWSGDENEHVRRLVSEGTRPRLPWGMRLHQFVEDPSPVVELLEKLKDDPSEYVRRSVANNLNDIAKDHPDLVTSLAKAWMVEASEDRTRLVRHALRSLVKAGNPEALAVLGYGQPKIELSEFSVTTPQIVFGSPLEFEVQLDSTSSKEQKLLIDYVVHHVKANGRTSPKVFKWKNITVAGGETLTASRKHPIRAITTRRYYPGTHRVELQINGQTYGGADFELSGVPDSI